MSTERIAVNFGCLPAPAHCLGSKSIAQSLARFDRWIFIRSRRIGVYHRAGRGRAIASALGSQTGAGQKFADLQIDVLQWSMCMRQVRSDAAPV
ncbi:hypothetical protein CV770_03975 [Bradyrhizobium sp. AC87j1]|nr:hypothetical protein CV770_03975 [Bradyrhizobium sp. AC87j1]